MHQEIIKDVTYIYNIYLQNSNINNYIMIIFDNEGVHQDSPARGIVD